MKKNYVRQEDYDFYSIRLPLKIAFSRRRKKYILRELEKLHPKLTASCFIKSWLRLKKWKLQADVAIMEKSLLARYKSEFPRSSIYLPEKEQSPFLVKNRKFSAVSGLFLIVVAGFFLGKIVLEIFAQNKKIMEKKNALIYEKTEVPKKTAEPVLLAPSELIISVFSSVSKNGGRISSFSWKQGVCTFSVVGCSSEDVAQAQYCVVSYKDNKPQFTLSVPVLENKFFEKSDSEVHLKKLLENIQDESNLLDAMQKIRSSGAAEIWSQTRNFKSALENKTESNFENPIKSDYQLSVKNVRNELFKRNASIKKEYITEDFADFEFIVPDETFASALKICGTEAKKLGWLEKSFSIEKSENQNIVKVLFSREKEGENIDFCFSPVFLAANYAQVFKNENLKVVPKAKSFVNKTAKPFAAKYNNEIGKITKNDGFTYIYYRQNDGKIIAEKIAM